jgi:hypothetical protein
LSQGRELQEAVVGQLTPDEKWARHLLLVAYC